jgi:hypothetical protein
VVGSHVDELRESAIEIRVTSYGHEHGFFPP